MANYQLYAEIRSESGKKVTRQLRARNRVPAVVYGAEKENVFLSVHRGDLEKAIVARPSLVDLKVDNGQTHTVIIKEIQNEPVKGIPLHVDFFEVDLDKPVDTTVSITLVGEDGRESDGGVVALSLFELSISCLPKAIPETIEVDVSGLKIGESLYVSDLSIPEGITVKNEPDELVVQVMVPQVDTAEADDADVEADTADTAEAGEGEESETTGEE